MKEDKIRKILREFDEELGTQVSERIKNIPIIMNIFQQFIRQIYESDGTYSKALSIEKKIIKKMKINSRQKRLLEHFQDCENAIANELMERAFAYGYAIHNEEIEEIKKIKTLRDQTN